MGKGGTQTGTARGGGVCRREVGKTKSNRSWESGYLTQKCRVGNAREGTKKKGWTIGRGSVGPTKIYDGDQLKYISTSLGSYLKWNSPLRYTHWTVYSLYNMTFHWLI